jgi:hypothetical protein
MPYRPWTEEEKFVLEEQLKEAKARLTVQMQYVQNLEEQIIEGAWFMAPEEYQKYQKEKNERGTDKSPEPGRPGDGTQ